MKNASTEIATKNTAITKAMAFEEAKDTGVLLND